MGNPQQRGDLKESVEQGRLYDVHILSQHLVI